MKDRKKSYHYGDDNVAAFLPIFTVRENALACEHLFSEQNSQLTNVAWEVDVTERKRKGTKVEKREGNAGTKLKIYQS